MASRRMTQLWGVAAATAAVVVGVVLLIKSSSWLTIPSIMYPVLFVNVFLGIAICLAQISPTHTIDAMEIVFTCLWGPLSSLLQLGNVTNLRMEIQNLVDISEPEADFPVWLRQAMTLALIDTDPWRKQDWLYCLLVAKFVCTTARDPEENKDKLTLSDKFGTTAFFIRTLMSLATFIFVMVNLIWNPIWWQMGVSVIYCLVVERHAIKYLVKFIDSSLASWTDGMGDMLGSGFYFSLEICISFTYILISLTRPKQYPVVVIVLITNVLQPLHDVMTMVIPVIREGRRVLRHFRKATSGDLLAYNDICAICLLPMKHARVTPCNHLFHGNCLRLSMKEKNSCPLCNHMLTVSG